MGVSYNLNSQLQADGSHKLTIYQVMVRLFGNKKAVNKMYGTKEENGVGKFADITEAALQEIRKMGITHVWYTGAIEHATMSDYGQYGIPLDDADVIKGRAGSPYAIKDYYDVDPDLAVDPRTRMEEFQELIERTHQQGLKAIIDFVPNHLARNYRSDRRPEGAKEFGEEDDITKSFDPDNNFYYIPGKEFVVPAGYSPLGADERGPNEDGRFEEIPAKATGNDVFTEHPTVNDWFETIKLNYGVDMQGGGKTYFDPIPATWHRMYEILLYWAQKGIDGFRCDVAEMVPVEFWGWVIPRIKTFNPKVIFIAEIYKPFLYKQYIEEGRFDYLYDKVGLYDTLRDVMEGKRSVERIRDSWRGEMEGLSSYMLRFLENHDEQRIASSFFVGNPWAGVPGMVVAATLGTGPVMVYFGQEVGEPGKGIAGFSKEDGRTTIFDYWGVPEHQKWMNEGAFDGAKLEEEQKRLRKFYVKLLQLCRSSEAIQRGAFYELHFANANGQSIGYKEESIYTYLRYTDRQRLMIVVNFHPEGPIPTCIKIPQEAWSLMGLDGERKYVLRDMLSEDTEVATEDVMGLCDQQGGIPLVLLPNSAYILEIADK